MSQVKKVLDILNQEYPDADCSLNYENPLQLLVATILSAQCTDERVNKVTVDLFQKYKTVEDYAQAPVEEFQQYIRSTGFYKNKAKNIISAAQRIATEFDGEVPDNMKDLTSLAGVARKTANVLLGNVFKKADGIVVDTHVGRLSQRLGWTTEKNAEKIEKVLMEIIPKEEWIDISHRIILHGRAVCNAKKPKCEECQLASLCPSVKK